MKRLLLVALITGLAILLWHRHDGPIERVLASRHPVAVQAPAGALLPPMPIAGAPLFASQPTLLARARLGDRAASARLSSELHQCMEAKRLASFFGDKTLGEWMARPEATAGRSPEALAALQVVVAKSMNYVDQRKALCSGMDGEFDNALMLEAWSIAARLGDDDATACLLYPSLELPASMTKADREAYDREAMELAQRGLADGNWHVVLGLIFVYSYSGVEGQIGPVSHIDWRQRLRMDWLLKLSYPEGSPAAIERNRAIAIVQERVTAEEASSAERDAREMFERSFRHVPPLPANELNCVAPGMG